MEQVKRCLGRIQLSPQGRLFLLGALQQDMERPWRMGPLSRTAPLLTGLFQDLQQALELVIGCLVKQMNALADQKNIGISWQPRQIGKTFVEGVPVLAEVRREL